MSTDSCSTNQILYVGNGTQTLYTFPFTYLDSSDVYVDLYDFTTSSWVNTTEWSFQNETTIQFNTAPPAPASSDPSVPNIKIFRNTDVTQMTATFFPGSAIRAKDLNNNFEEILFITQETKCNIITAVDSSDEAIKIAEEADAKADTAIGTANEAKQESSEAKQEASEAKADAAEAAKDAADAAESAAKAEQAAQDAGDVGLLFDVDPGGGTATKGSNKVPIEFPQGIQLPTQTASYDANNAIRVNTANEKLEVRIDGDWTTASAGAEVAANPPSPATEGDVWWDESDGRSYVYYTDSNSSQWVEMNPSWNGSVANGVITPDKLSIGGPDWDTSGNLTVDGGITAAGGKFEIENTGQFTFEPEADAGKVSTTWSGGVDNSTSIIGKNKDGTETWRLKADGSITAAGSVVAGSTTTDTGSHIFSANRTGGALFARNYGTGASFRAEASTAQNAFQWYNKQCSYYWRRQNHCGWLYSISGRRSVWC